MKYRDEEIIEAVRWDSLNFSEQIINKLNKLINNGKVQETFKKSRIS